MVVTVPVEVINESGASFFQSEIVASLNWNFRLMKSEQDGKSGVKVSLPELRLDFVSPNAFVKGVSLFLPVLTRGDFYPLFIKPTFGLFDLFADVRYIRVMKGKTKNGVIIAFKDDKYTRLEGYANKDVFVSPEQGEFCKKMVDKFSADISGVMDNPEWINEVGCEKLNALRDEFESALA